MEIEKLQSAIEAILFTMGDSVEISKLAFAIGHDEETTKKLVRNMMERYEKEDRGIRIIELEDSFQLCTKKEMYEYLIRVAKQPKRYALTDVLLETLSIVAYKQPVTKLEIEKIRGVKSDHAVNKLVEYAKSLRKEFYIISNLAQIDLFQINRFRQCQRLSRLSLCFHIR